MVKTPPLDESIQDIDERLPGRRAARIGYGFLSVGFVAAAAVALLDDPVDASTWRRLAVFLVAAFLFLFSLIRAGRVGISTTPEGVTAYTTECAISVPWAVIDRFEMRRYPGLGAWCAGRWVSLHGPLPSDRQGAWLRDLSNRLNRQLKARKEIAPAGETTIRRSPPRWVLLSRFAVLMTVLVVYSIGEGKWFWLLALIAAIAGARTWLRPKS